MQVVHLTVSLKLHYLLAFKALCNIMHEYVLCKQALFVCYCLHDGHDNHFCMDHYRCYYVRIYPLLQSHTGYIFLLEQRNF